MGGEGLIARALGVGDNRTIVRVSDCGWLWASATLLARAVSEDNL
jgi:hypothetical protein